MTSLWRNICKRL